jgi:hypothetical protein
MISWRYPRFPNQLPDVTRLSFMTRKNLSGVHLENMGWSFVLGFGFISKFVERYDLFFLSSFLLG